MQAGIGSLRLTRCHWLVWTSDLLLCTSITKNHSSRAERLKEHRVGKRKSYIGPKAFSCVQEHEWNSLSCNCAFAIAAYGDCDWLVWYRRFLLHVSRSCKWTVTSRRLDPVVEEKVKLMVHEDFGWESLDGLDDRQPERGNTVKLIGSENSGREFIG